jgi:hypothetical protein
VKLTTEDRDMLRLALAAVAMHALIPTTAVGKPQPVTVSDIAVMYADALLAALEKAP